MTPDNVQQILAAFERLERADVAVAQAEARLRPLLDALQADVHGDPGQYEAAERELEKAMQEQEAAWIETGVEYPIEDRFRDADGRLLEIGPEERRYNELADYRGHGLMQLDKLTDADWVVFRAETDPNDPEWHRWSDVESDFEVILNKSGGGGGQHFELRTRHREESEVSYRTYLLPEANWIAAMRRGQERFLERLPAEQAAYAARETERAAQAALEALRAPNESGRGRHFREGRGGEHFRGRQRDEEPVPSREMGAPSQAWLEDRSQDRDDDRGR